MGASVSLRLSSSTQNGIEPTKALTKLSIEACDDAQTGCLRNKHNNVSGFVGIFPSGCDQKSNSSLLPHCQDIAPWLRLTFW